MQPPSLMMYRPALISGILTHGVAHYGYQEIVSRETHGPLYRYTFGEMGARAAQLAHALRRLGLKDGATVGSIAWNNHRHVEAYYAVSGSGMVMTRPQATAPPTPSRRRSAPAPGPSRG